MQSHSENHEQQPEAGEDSHRKAQIRDRLMESLMEYRIPGIWTDIALSQKFETTTLTVIAMNAVWIGVEIDANDDDDGGMNFFRIVENLFCVYFTFEISCRMLSYKTMRMFFSTDELLRYWNIFDLVLVSFMVLENWILYFIIGDSNIGALSAMRLLRLLRISRIIRMLPELKMMVKSMTAALRSVSSTMILCIGLIYVFAIIMTQWGKEHPTPPEHVDTGTKEDCCTYQWGTIGDSFLSLMQILVYDDTFSLIRITMEYSMFHGLFLICFIIIGSFTMLNMLIGVIVEIVQETKKQEEEKVLLQRVGSLFEKMDADESGTVTKSELIQYADVFASLGLEKSSLMVAFELADKDLTGDLSIEEFVYMVTRLLHPPTSQDLLILQRNVNKICEKFEIQFVEPSGTAQVDNSLGKFIKANKPEHQAGLQGADVQKLKSDMIIAEAESARLREELNLIITKDEGDKGGSGGYQASTGGQGLTE
jgi:voltage-gated sodium channel